MAASQDGSAAGNTDSLCKREAARGRVTGRARRRRNATRKRDTIVLGVPLDGTDRPDGGSIPGGGRPGRPYGTGVGTTIEPVMRESDVRHPRAARSSPAAGGPRADMA
nr:hypothetical protein GCM10010200_043700 [Actinomadura rugatobispora]